MAIERRRSAGDVRLHRLSNLSDFEVADWDPDIRGWNVIDETGEKVGEIDELIVAPEARKVRYLDVEIAAPLRRDGERHVLVPIGVARLEEDNHQVVLQGIDRGTLSNAPAYGGEPIDRAYERSLRAAYVPAGTPAPSDEDFYAHDHFDTKRFRRPWP